MGESNKSRAIAAVACYSVLSTIQTWIIKKAYTTAQQYSVTLPLLVVFLQQLSTTIIIITYSWAKRRFQNPEPAICQQSEPFCLSHSAISRQRHAADPVRRKKTIMTPGRCSITKGLVVEGGGESEDKSAEIPNADLKSLSFGIWSTGKEAANRRMTLAIAASLVLQIVLSNYCLTTVSLVSYQAARSTSLPFSILANWFIVGESISSSAIIASGLVGGGYLLCVVHPEDKVSLSGLALGGLASLFGVLYMGLYRQTALHANTSQEKLRPLLSITIVTTLLLFPFVCIFYIFPLISSGMSQFVLPPKQQVLLTGATLLISPILSISTAYSLASLPPLTCAIAGFFKSCVQALVGSFLFSAPLSAQNVAGVLLCLTGTLGYSIAPPSKKQKK